MWLCVTGYWYAKNVPRAPRAGMVRARMSNNVHDKLFKRTFSQVEHA